MGGVAQDIDIYQSHWRKGRRRGRRGERGMGWSLCRGGSSDEDRLTEQAQELKCCLVCLRQSMGQLQPLIQITKLPTRQSWRMAEVDRWGGEGEGGGGGGAGGGGVEEREGRWRRRLKVLASQWKQR